ncbi:MAG TPA: recombination mediator RecR [Ktedonobacteraceae bacterium]|nr:recombination mediator RecR [Ktedonobacteraceae bacterium]
MNNIAPPVAALIDEFSKLPGVGVKTAQRFTFFLLRSPDDQARRLAEAIVRIKERTVYCSRCFNITESNPCPTCSDPARDQDVICVVEEPLDVLALEKTGSYKGLYHVLHGALSPMDGIGPSELHIDKLVERVRKDKAREVILAMNPNFQGEYTANYIKDELRPLGPKVTGLARGLPLGGDLEYADEDTLRRALEGRRDM